MPTPIDERSVAKASILWTSWKEDLTPTTPRFNSKLTNYNYESKSSLFDSNTAVR
jgi:hypothetical protein